MPSCVRCGHPRALHNDGFCDECDCAMYEDPESVNEGP